jgi:hypothetical protein
VIVLFAAAGRGTSGLAWIGLALGAVIVGVGIGVLIGAGRLGALGFAGCVGGALAGALLPYLVVPRLLGLIAPDIGLYGEYLPGVAATLSGALIGMAVATRLVLHVFVPPVATFVFGLVVLALWFSFWLVVSPTARSAGIGVSYRTGAPAVAAASVIQEVWGPCA